MCELFSHIKLTWKVIITDNFPPIVDLPICLWEPLSPWASRFSEEAAVDFSWKKERNCSYVLSSQVTGLCWVSAVSIDIFKSLCRHGWNQENFRLCLHGCIFVWKCIDFDAFSPSVFAVCKNQRNQKPEHFKNDLLLAVFSNVWGQRKKKVMAFWTLFIDKP